MKTKHTNFLKLVVLLIVGTFLLLPIHEEIVQASTVKLNKTSATLYAGDTLQLTMKGTTKKVKWSSSDKKIASVDNSGKVTAKKEGSAKITAKVNGKSYTCKITVRLKITVEKKTVLNQNGIVIKTQSLKETTNAYTLNFLITNKGTDDYSVVAHSYAVNSLFYGDNLYGFKTVSVPAGKKTKYSISVDKTWLKTNKMKYLKDFTIVFWGYTNGWAELQSDPIVISTSAVDDVKAYKPSGEKVYKDSNITLWYTGKTDDGYNFVLYNKSAQDDYTIENMSVNDWAYEISGYDLYDETMITNTYATFCIPVESSFLEENNIKKIKSIEFDIEMGYKVTTDKIKIDL